MIRPIECDRPLARRSVPAVWLWRPPGHPPPLPTPPAPPAGVPAVVLWRSPSIAPAGSPRSASSGATGGDPLTTRDTVLSDTPATAATSFIVGRFPFTGGQRTRPGGAPRGSNGRDFA